jgi:hypothetical protein
MPTGQTTSQAKKAMTAWRALPTSPIPTSKNIPQITPDNISSRWVGRGWTVFNNKGKPIRQYEPFFTDTHCLFMEGER